MEQETQNQMDHWIRAMTREILIHDRSPLSEKAGKFQVAHDLALETYQRTSPIPSDVFDNPNDQTESE